MKSPTPKYNLQASLFSSLEKPFLLPTYVEAIARASPTRQPTCVPNRCHLVDLRILDLLDISATDDTSFLLDFSNFGSTSLFGGISERTSSMSTRCSDDSMSPSS
jgi:hypothetical protein